MAFLYRILALIAFIYMSSVLADTVDNKKYCGYLDCQGKVKPGLDGEKFAAKDFAFGYCYCAEGEGKKIGRYMACNFGDAFVLTEQRCVRNGTP